MLHVVLIPAKQPLMTPAEAPMVRTANVPRWGFPELFIISQTAIPALMFLPGSQALRVPIRVGAFVISLFGLVLWWHAKRSRHRGWQPAQLWLFGALAYLGLMLFHPTTNTLKAGLAQIVLYLAVLAPVFWAPVLVRGPRHLARLLVLLFLCNGANSIVGILQVYHPAVWMPEELSRVVTASPYGLDAVSYFGPDGRRIIRPPGLFDSPGAVCGPAMITVLLGLFFSVSAKGIAKKLLAGGLAVAGLAAIYLSQVRSSLIVVTVMVLVLSGLLMFQRKQKLKATVLLALYGLLIMAAFSFAVGLGGQSIHDRFTTLLETDPFDLFYATRGEQLEYGFRTLLLDYPFGAGLGRWGMINFYFRDPYNFKSSTLWAEVQPNAWIVDGGLILLGLYGAALAANTWANFRMVLTTETSQRHLLAAAVLAANVGTLALVFSFTPFTSQIGMQYWLLSGALFGAFSTRPEPAT
jgi:hypothetical protein